MSRAAGSPWSMLCRFVASDDAQELVEYAYLAAFVGLVGIVVWDGIVALLGQHYANANTNVESHWASPNH